jgi:imidazolonepropionase-like amidohydrolase
MEAFDGIPHNVALLAAAKARPIMHSDSSTEVRFLNQQAAKARAAGEQLGLAFSDDEVLRVVTANPAWALGIDDKTGTLEVGKMGDVVLWSKSPFSIYARAKLVLIDGEVIYEDGKPMRPTDFELGTVAIDRSGARREVEVKP